MRGNMIEVVKYPDPGEFGEVGTYSGGRRANGATQERREVLWHLLRKVLEQPQAC